MELVTASQALGYARMYAHCKEEVIAYLAATDLPASRRRRWYREWCEATSSACRREDLDRVAPPRKPREQQLSLLPE